MSPNVVFTAVLAATLVLMLAACAPAAPADASTPTGLPSIPTDTPAPLTAEQRGQVVFFELGCISCHSITGSGGRVGPDLKGIAARVAAERPSEDVAAYVRAGIVDVMKDVGAEWRGDLMPQNYGERLSAQQVDDLVAYLIALE
jgi:cytochrome c551/c552